MIPYGRHSIDQEDIDAVVQVLKSDWLTTGPMVEKFELEVSRYLGVENAVAVNSGTAALHAAMNALNVGPGDEVIVPAITFAATANAVVYQGGTPIFADVDAKTLLIDPESVQERISPRTKAIVAVDYAGQPCDYDELRTIADQNKISLVADACHSLGATYKGRRVGTLADLSVFSFHPVKHITTGEGGMVVTNDGGLAKKMRRFRNHGISVDHHARAAKGSWEYDIDEVGYNYRITDFQCALGLCQLGRIEQNLERRNDVARMYDDGLSDVNGAEPLVRIGNKVHAYHLYVLSVDNQICSVKRNQIYRELRARGIGTNVHYKPVYLHSFFKERYDTCSGLCPVAEKAYNSIISLPMYHGIRNEDVDDVIKALRGII